MNISADLSNRIATFVQLQYTKIGRDVTVTDHRDDERD